MKDARLTTGQVAEWVGGVLEGSPAVELSRLAPIDSAGPGELTFAADNKHAARLARCRAGAAIVSRSAPPAPLPLIRVENVHAAVAALLKRLGDGEDLPPVGVHPTAVVASDAKIGADVAIGPCVVLGPRATIGPRSVLCAGASVGADAVVGADCVLADGVVVKYACRLGDRVRVGPNSVLGADGFGYYFADGVHHKVPHIGNVVVEDDVEIGACSCVDRAKFGSTRIGAGTKIDNLVQVAHNVDIGRSCLLVAQCGVAGSSRLGNYVVLGGNAGVRDNITLGDAVQCSAFAAVAQDVPDGESVIGVPARPAREALRIFKAEERLPDLLKRVKDLESRLAKLESSKDH